MSNCLTIGLSVNGLDSDTLDDFLGTLIAECLVRLRVYLILKLLLLNIVAVEVEMRLLAIFCALMFFPSMSQAGIWDLFSDQKENWLSECELSETVSEKKYKVYRQTCSQTAYQNLSEGYRITDHFSVPEPLARRTNFWKMIYSYFSVNDYVIHSADYPEVIFEIVHQINPQKKNIAKPRRAIRTRVKHLQKLLWAMHRKSKGNFTNPQQQEIAAAMSHIADRDKYKKAANSLRSQKGQREFVIKGYVISQRFLPAIEKEFIKAGVPTDLAKIAFVESSFNIKAYSKVGAAGIYQIMPFVAKKHMRVDKYIDERRDPIKSARVAAKLLKANYRMLGNWPLAVTAYNHGPFGIKRAVRHSKTDDLAKIIDVYRGRGFGFASQNFYAEYLAMLETITHAEGYFGKMEVMEPMQFEEIALPYTYRIKTILSRYKISREELIAYNPELFKIARGNRNLIRKGFTIKVPRRNVQ